MLGLQAWLCPDLITFPHEVSTWDQHVGWGQEQERCKETLQKSSTDQVPFQGKLMRQEGNLSFYLFLSRLEDGRFSEPIIEGSHFVMKSFPAS